MSGQWIILEKALDEYVNDIHERFKVRSEELTDAGLFTKSMKSEFKRELRYLDARAAASREAFNHMETMTRLILHEQ